MHESHAVADRSNTTRTLPELTTIEEVGAYLELSVHTLAYFRRRGLGPVAHRLGKHVRYYRADVLSWLANRPSIGGR